MTKGLGVIIVAAGASHRMLGADKVFSPILGIPLLAYAVETFDRSTLVDRIVVVVRSDAIEETRTLAESRHWRKVTRIIPGGDRRQDSVQAGLQTLGDCAWVAVHDGARPCVTDAVLERGLEAARETGAAIAAVPAKDTIKVTDAGGIVTRTLPRASLRLVQTPQIFRYALITQAYAQSDTEVTDDAALVEEAGHRVKTFMGAYENIKVTTPEDLILAELFLRQRMGAST